MVALDLHSGTGSFRLSNTAKGAGVGAVLGGLVYVVAGESNDSFLRIVGVPAAIRALVGLLVDVT